MSSVRLRRAFGATVALASAAMIAGGCGSDSKEASADQSKQPKPPAKTVPAEAPSTSNQPDTAPAVAPPPSAAPKATTFQAAIASGQPEGGPQVWRAKKGDRVRIAVTSDTADELHLHGYDVSKDVAAGGTAKLEFVADTSGSFELELENAGTLIGNLEVR